MAKKRKPAPEPMTWPLVVIGQDYYNLNQLIWAEVISPRQIKLHFPGKTVNLNSRQSEGFLFAFILGREPPNLDTPADYHLDEAHPKPNPPE